MKISDMQLEELELMSLTDLTYLILKENKKSMNTSDLFKKISDLLSFSESEYTSKIGDYYTSLNIDKRFVLLDNNEWDICDNHSVKIVLDDEEEEIEEEIEQDEEEIIEEEENIDEFIDDKDIDDDTLDLTIIEEDETDE